MTNKIDGAKDPLDGPEFISYNAMLRTLGALGLSLPFVLPLINKIARRGGTLQFSISHYYYTASGVWLESVLAAVALFLLCYRGYGDLRDRIAAMFAGACALGVALFPTNCDPKAKGEVLLRMPSGLRNTMHYSFAAGLFLTLTLMCFFLFTMSDQQNKKLRPLAKRRRNKVFRTCGGIMGVSVILLFCYFKQWLPHSLPYSTVYFLESLTLAAFGVSWLTKAEVFFPDRGRGALLAR